MEKSPHKRRAVTIEVAADYVSLTPESYRAAVARGVYPGPIPGTNRYDLYAIDQTLDRLSGIKRGESAAEDADPWLAEMEKWRGKRDANRGQAR